MQHINKSIKLNKKVKVMHACRCKYSQFKTATELVLINILQL